MFSRIASLSSLALLGAACTPREFNASRVKHDVDTPVNTIHGAQWGDPDTEIVKKFLVSMEENTPENQRTFTKGFLPQDHLLVKRYQAWLDRIDAHWRQGAAAAQMSQVPKPKLIAAVVDDAPNAFVMPAPTCISLKVRFENRAANPDDKTADVALFQAGEGTVTAMSMEELEGSLPCLLEPANGKEVAKDYLEHYNKRAASSDCQAQLDGNEVVFGSNCTIKNGTRKSGASKLILLPASSVITLFTSTVRLAKTDDEVVGVLAHELTHYYRSHFNQPASKDSFLYVEDPANPVKVPTPADKPELTDLMSRLNGLKRSLVLRDLEGAKYNRTALFSMLVGTPPRFLFPFTKTRNIGLRLLDMCDKSKNTCKSSCDGWRALTSQPAPANTLVARELGGGAILANPFSSISTADWISAEKAFSQCATAIRTAPVPMPGHMNTVGLAAWASISSLTGAEKHFSKLVGSKTFDDFLQKLSAVAQAELAETKALYAEASQKHLGWYTSEQEADQMALEGSAGAGSDPKGLLGFTTTAMAQFDMDLATGWSAQQCRDALNKGFRDGNGLYAIPPFGPVSDSHHNACYRAFDITRELDLHKYVQAAGSGSELPGGTWESFRASQGW